ncbi:MAG: helix-turn-helix domain-containing protein [Sulfitobacter sp.]|uniref:IclR family transcriptional regulator n=2 Tax=Pseudomonadota TaxID=1224 RepID=UPI002618D7EA|nr:helix-turn-helix domain-containing protein [Sulfitobacter sp.]|tara:strand:+ start:4100 stop:4792 length:693 start_codon:yes stop_codon:yes gene_type:complete
MTTGKLQTLDRGIEALLLVAEAPEGLTVGEIASRLDLHRAVTYRIVATLAERCMLRRVANGRIVLGAATYQLGAPTVDSIRSYALPVLERLAETTGATAFLSMADAEECEVVMTAEPREVAIAIHYRVGRRHPLTRGAAGIAILAARPETSMDTPDIRFARYHGYSITQGQLHKGAVGVSSAVRLSSGGRAPQEFSIGVVALEDLKLDEAAQAVVDAAQSLSKAVGGELM